MSMYWPTQWYLIKQGSQALLHFYGQCQLCRFYRTSVQASIIIATHKTEFIDEYNDLEHFEQYCHGRLSITKSVNRGVKADLTL